MTIVTQLRPVSSSVVIQSEQPVRDDLVPHCLAGRMIQITLALYLLPALLIVLMVGGTGLLVLKISRVLKVLFERSAD